MNILINGVGGPTPRSIARSLKQYSKFKNAKLIGTDINPYAHGLYEKELYDATYLVPPAHDPEYWHEIEKIITKHNIDIALVHPEVEVLEWAKRSENEDLPCKTLLPSQKMVEVLIDKSRMTEVLKDTDLVPKSFTINSNNPDYEGLENALSYPFWIRSTSGSSGLGSLKVENREALKNWFLINPKVEEFIASTYLQGRNLAVKMLYYNGKLLRTACAERVNYIMAKVAPSGITGNTSFGRLLNEPDLVATATRAMDLLFQHANCEKHGFFTADFKEDQNGKPYITEINIRMVAFNLSFAVGGANFSEDIVRLLSNDEEFDKTYKMYEFEKDLIFLRDVDTTPIVMKETDLLRK